MKIPRLGPLRPWDKFDFENLNYTVTVNGEKQFVHNVRVNMHDKHTAAMCSFELEGAAEVRISRQGRPISYVDIRPVSERVKYRIEGRELVLELEKPVRLSVEIDGDRLSNLHLFAERPTLWLPEGRRLEPGIHRKECATPRPGEILIFEPGLHYIEEGLINASNDCSVYLAPGAVVVGGIVCDGVSNVRIGGGGMIDLHSFERYTAFRGLRITDCKNVEVRDISIVNPPHYSVYLGASEHIRINGIKCFSSEGWSDGIDIMSCQDVVCENLFMRNSDDCVAIYASRWQHKGDTRGVTVRDSILWADVAHPMNIGIHGLEGDVIEDVVFENITVLNHNEPQKNYMGVMAITAGDGIVVRNIHYRNITVERVEKGRLFDVRTVKNRDYNCTSGKRVENVSFENIRAIFCGEPSVISGFSRDCPVNAVTFNNICIENKRAATLGEADIRVGDFAENIRIS